MGSFLLVDLTALIAAVPQPEGAPPVELPPLWLLKTASFLQTAVLTMVAVLAGILLAGRVGLHSPAAEAAANGEPVFAALKPQLLPGILAGLASGVAIVVVWVVAKPFLTLEFIAKAEEFNRLLPPITRLFYGGLTEELLLRWGFMTFLVWASWRLFQKGQGMPRPIYFVAAILVSAVIFGIGHLPIAYMLAGDLTVPLVAYVIAANSLFGIAAGFLYWKKGLEAAMIAHMFAHVVLIAAISIAL